MCERLSDSELYERLPALLLPWYAQNARVLPWRLDREPYHVWLSEIMLQQTRVEAVKGYYARFLECCPTLEALANAPSDALRKLWEGLGYYSRVRNLQSAAQAVMEKHGGVFPRTYDEVLALPGIGPYTAGAICSIAFDLPTPAVDGNVLRVVTRLQASTENITDERTKKAVRDALAAVYPPEAGTFTQSLMELGATVCVPNGVPKCGECPLKEICRGRETWEQYPMRDVKKPRRIEDRTVLVLRCGEEEAVRKRPKKGLLAELWEYPNVPGTLDPAEAIAQAGAWGCEPADIQMQLDRVHIFTHVQWNLRCYYITCRAEPEQFTWASPEQMEKEIALPTAFRMFLRR
ncbi:MAG: A/G-specific adenine glycosylase [Oscillospiraceae bacterium]|nr:A/G-specific adenine glycosylase [Oscillospiraceae bacterium]